MSPGVAPLPSAHAGTWTRTRRALVLAAGLALFAVLITANSAGYRYGASDQAFYLPAILRDVRPELFPRDRVLLAAQDELMVSDELVATIARTSGVALPRIFLAGYALTIALAFFTGFWFARAFFATGPAAAAFLVLLTLRHRITRTGANTFEGYFHPRLIAFALGVAALGAVLRCRPALALGAAGLAMVLHPTTGLWCVVLVAVAIWVNEPRWRRALSVAGIVAVLGAGWLLVAGPLAPRLQPMAPEWTAVFEGKDYVLPTEWPAGAWVANLGYLTLTVFVYRRRNRLGLALPAERGLVAGAAVLTAIFLLSLPFIAGRLALAIQLQVSRVFWVVDFVAGAYLVWALVDRPALRARAAGRVPRAALAAALALLVVSISRGAYIMLVERPERALIEATLPHDDWHRVGEWARATAPDSHFLVDPGHTYRFGTSFRITGERDVLLEEVKDTALALYSPEIARRVGERIAAIGSFDTLTTDRLAVLDRRYDLDYLVDVRDWPLPLAFTAGRFRVYRLDDPPRAASRR